VFGFGGLLLGSLGGWLLGSGEPQKTVQPSAGENTSPSIAATLTTFGVYRQHTDIVYSVAWSPDGRSLVSASRDHTAQIWDASTLQHLLTYRGHTDIIYSAAWNHDSALVASAGADQTAQVWDLTGQPIATVGDLHRIVSCVCWSPRSNLLATASLNGDEIIVYSLPADLVGRRYHLGVNQIYAASWSPDGRRLAVGSGGGAGAPVQVWDVISGKPVMTYNGHQGAVYALAWSPDGRSLASGGQDKMVHICNAQSGELTQMYGQHTDVIHALAWSQQGEYVASGGADRSVHVWTVPANVTLHTYKEHLDAVRGLAWEPSGKRIASASADKTVRIWQAL
jgi:WD40 repeat protein